MVIDLSNPGHLALMAAAFIGTFLWTFFCTCLTEIKPARVKWWQAAIYFALVISLIIAVVIFVISLGMAIAHSLFDMSQRA